MPALRVIALTALACLAPAAPAFAEPPKVLHVAPASATPPGDDANDCLSAATPCLSFDRAYQAAALGDAVEVAAGRYTFQAIRELEGRTAERDRPDVTFRPAPGADVVLDCWDDGSHCIGVEGHHVTVEGMRTADLEPIGGLEREGGVCICRGSFDVTLRDIDAGYLYIAGDSASVYGGDFGPITEFVSKIEYGDDGPSEDIVIDGARFHDHRMYESHVECIAAYSGVRVAIRNSTFDNCEVFSIFLSPGGDQVATDYTIENNVFMNSGEVPMSAHLKANFKPGADCSGLTVRYNTFLEDNIVKPGADCSNLTVRYNTFLEDNIVSDCPGEGIRWHSNVFELGGCGAVGRFDHNIWLDEVESCGERNLVVEDLGLTAAGRLAAGSPAIGFGDPSDAPARDVDGDRRPRGWGPDAGADEWAGSEPLGTLPGAAWLVGYAYALIELPAG
jgi:hypothetical protein